ncbi:MAG: hypothetical protein MUD12_05515 [Spirochaetes bacterium]|nr:hypothetical protein [Spirochaetota bacterium]
MQFSSRPYIDYRFLGIKSFISALHETASEYRIFEADDYSILYDDRGGMLKSGEDTVMSGVLLKDGGSVYFTEFGMKITKSHRAYFVFIFDHHPFPADLKLISDGLEDLVLKNLEGVDITDLAENIRKNICDEEKTH